METLNYGENINNSRALLYILNYDLYLVTYYARLYNICPMSVGPQCH